MADSEIKEGAVYRHYKQGLYRVHALVLHSETLEEMVVYEALYENSKSRWWARPRSMFVELVTVGQSTMPRFSLVDQE